MSFTKAQEILDEHKQQLPDGLYKQMSDLFMKGHNEAKDVYLVTYLEPVIEPYIDEDYEEDFLLSVSIKKRILQIKREDYTEIKEQINRFNYAHRFDILPNKFIISKNTSVALQRKIIDINPIQ